MKSGGVNTTTTQIKRVNQRHQPEEVHDLMTFHQAIDRKHVRALDELAAQAQALGMGDGGEWQFPRLRHRVGDGPPYWQPL